MLPLRSSYNSLRFTLLPKAILMGSGKLLIYNKTMDKDDLCNKCGLRPQTGERKPPCKPKRKKCCKKDCCENDFVFRKVVIPAALGDDETGKDKPAVGAHVNAFVEYEANGAQYIYDSYGVYTKFDPAESQGSTDDFNALKNRPRYAGERMTGGTNIPDVAEAVAAEATAREEADTALSSRIDAIPTDVYTKTETNTLLDEKQNALTAGDNITIENDVISATQEQSDYTENDSTASTYIKNRPFYEETVENTVEQYGSTSAGATPDADYVWFIEKVEGYSTTDELAGFSDGDTLTVTFTYSVNGVERTDSGKFVVTEEDGHLNLDSDVPAGTRWTGAYASELDGDTTFRWPVAAADSSATVYLTGIKYEKITQLDAKYIPVDGETIIVNQDGELESAGGGSSGIPTDATFWGQSYDSANNRVQGDIISGIGYGLWRDSYKRIGIYFESSTVMRVGSVSSGARLNIWSNNIDVLNGFLRMNNNKISGLADPTDQQDAATKNYVDSFYPVGAVYTSTSATAPTFAGGTWAQIGSQVIGSSTVYYYERTA